MKVKAESVGDIQDSLGEAGETEFTFLLCPVETYAILSEQARSEGCSVGVVLQKAVLQYLRAAHGADQRNVGQPSGMGPEPDLVIRRKKRS